MDGVRRAPVFLELADILDRALLDHHAAFSALIQDVEHAGEQLVAPPLRIDHRLDHTEPGVAIAVPLVGHAVQARPGRARRVLDVA